MPGARELSIRALAELHGVHRRTVRAALASAVPAPRKVPVRVAPKTFTDPRLCAAIVGLLTFGGNIIETGTVSYRLAHTRAQRAAT